MMQVASYEDYVCKKPEVCTRIECIRSMSVEEMADKILALEISTTLDFCQNFCGECENIPESECKKMFDSVAKFHGTAKDNSNRVF